MAVPKTRGEAYTLLMEHLRQCEEQTAFIAHFHNTEDGIGDRGRAKQWLQASEAFRQLGIKLTHLAQGRLQ